MEDDAYLASLVGQARLQRGLCPFRRGLPQM